MSKFLVTPVLNQIYLLFYRLICFIKYLLLNFFHVIQILVGRKLLHRIWLTALLFPGCEVYNLILLMSIIKLLKVFKVLFSIV